MKKKFGGLSVSNVESDAPRTFIAPPSPANRNPMPAEVTKVMLERQDNAPASKLPSLSELEALTEVSVESQLAVTGMFEDFPFSDITV